MEFIGSTVGDIKKKSSSCAWILYFKQGNQDSHVKNLYGFSSKDLSSMTIQHFRIRSYEWLWSSIL